MAKPPTPESHRADRAGAGGECAQASGTGAVDRTHRRARHQATRL